MTNSGTNSRPLDGLDRRLLAELQRDCTQSAARLAERCGTTESTALRRWKRLKRDGVIAREVAVVDPAMAGRPLQMVLTIKVEREGPANIPGLVEEISRHDAVTHFFHVTGEPDYVAVLSVRSMAEYEEFVTGVLDAWPHFATRTLVVIKPLKSGYEIPIDRP